MRQQAFRLADVAIATGVADVDAQLGIRGMFCGMFRRVQRFEDRVRRAPHVLNLLRVAIQHLKHGERSTLCAELPAHL